MVSLLNRPEYYNNPYKAEEYTGTNFLGNPNFPQYSALQAGQNYYSNLPNYRGNAYGMNTPKMSNQQKGFSSLGQQMAMNNQMGMANNVTPKMATKPNLTNNLLNYIVSPQGKGMAQGLLEASGYSNTPVGFGQALALGMQRGNEAQTRADAQKLKEQQFQFQKDQAKIQEKLIESQIFKNLNPQQALSNTAKQMRDGFPNLIPGTPEYQDKFMEILKNNAASVNITNEAQGAGAEKMAEIDAEYVGNTRKLANENLEMFSRLNIMNNLVDKEGFETGPLKEATLPMRNFLAENNLLTEEQSEQLSNEKLFEAMANYLVPRMRVVGSGATSDFEAKLFSTATAGLGKDTMSNKILVKSMLAVQEYNKKYAREMDKYYRRKVDGKGQFNLDGFDEYMDNELKENPIFKKYANDNDFAKAVKDGQLKKNDLYYDLEDNQFRIVDNAMLEGAKDL